MLKAKQPTQDEGKARPHYGHAGAEREKPAGGILVQTRRKTDDPVFTVNKAFFEAAMVSRAVLRAGDGFANAGRRGRDEGGRDEGGGAMSGGITALAGTPEGHQIAVVLALSSALLHAIFGALQKGRHDPWLSRGAIDVCYGLMALPVALWIVPWPEPNLWPIFAGAFVIHSGYKTLQAMAYTRGAYTVVYPVVRGTAPLFAILGAGLVFGEHFTGVQWLGLALLLSGIFGLAGYNLSRQTVGRAQMKVALALAVVTGGFVATYTTLDAYGVRATVNPFTFLAWFFVIDGLFFMPTLAALRWRSMDNPPAIGPLMRRGMTGAFIAFGSFGGIIMATRLDKVGEVAVLRETSSVFAALIGWLLLKEATGPIRVLLMGLIAAGAVVVEMGS